MWTAIVTLSLLAVAAGALLAVAYRSLPATGPESLAEQVNDLLPQTQCAQCGYPGCRPYAEAIVRGDAPINLCPPGGDTTVRHLAELPAQAAADTNPVLRRHLHKVDASLRHL